MISEAARSVQYLGHNCSTVLYSFTISSTALVEDYCKEQIHFSYLGSSPQFITRSSRFCKLTLSRRSACRINKMSQCFSNPIFMMSSRIYPNACGFWSVYFCFWMIAMLTSLRDDFWIEVQDDSNVTIACFVSVIILTVIMYAGQEWPKYKWKTIVYVRRWIRDIWSEGRWSDRRPEKTA
jgi:hypothetical protein